LIDDLVRISPAIKFLKDRPMPTHHNTVKGILACLLCIVLSACAGTATVPPLTRTPQITPATTPEKTTPTNFPATPQQVPTTSQSLQTSHTPTPAPRLSATPAAGSQTSVVSLNPQAILTEQAYQLAIELTATQ
jgi:hypothetical protein